MFQIGALAALEHRLDDFRATDFDVYVGMSSGASVAAALAGGRDVRLGGGVATVRQYLRAGLVDELHLAISPVLLGSGEHLLKDINMPALGYECAKHVAGERAMHVLLRKRV